MSERTSEWPGTLRVDFIFFQPNVQRSKKKVRKMKGDTQTNEKIVGGEDLKEDSCFP